MTMYATTDVAASVRKAHEAYTHVVVNRGYETIKPVFFRSALIADLPVYHWMSWKPETDSQLTRWREKGGVLLDCATTSGGAGPADALVFVECPLTMARLEESARHVSEYTVIPLPHTWRVHEECVNLRTPSVEALEPLWQLACDRRVTDEQLAHEAGLPRAHVTYMRSNLRPREEWVIKPRLAPETPALLPAWEWVGKGRTAQRREVRESGHKVAVKEMARLGHVALEKLQCYPRRPPDWTTVGERHAAATEDLARIRFLLESLPDHLAA